MTVPLVFLDTETDGVHPDRKAWEVAMVRRSEYGQFETQFFVDIDLMTADPFGLKVGRFYDRHPLGRQISAASSNDWSTSEAWEGEDWQARVLPEARAAMRIARWTHGAHIVGAVPNFDTETLAPLLRRHGLCPSWHYHLIDVEALAVGWLAARGETPTLPWKSDNVSGVCGVEPPSEEERHTAMGDALWAMRLYDRIVGADVVAVTE